MTAGRYVPVMFLRPDDDRRRWLVIDLRPWEGKAGSRAGKAGTVVADVMGEGNATRIADALNGQPTLDEELEAALAEVARLEALIPPPAPPEATGEPDADGVRQAY